VVQVALELGSVLWLRLRVNEVGSLGRWLLPQAAQIEQEVLMGKGHAHVFGLDRPENGLDSVGHRFGR
jgi:hypothetical protein